MSYTLSGDDAFNYDKHKTTKQKKGKLNKFKRSSKTTGLIFKFCKRS